MNYYLKIRIRMKFEFKNAFHLIVRKIKFGLIPCMSDICI